MPEGHTLRRLADGLHERFAGEIVAVSSPQGRFAEAAAVLDRSEVRSAESWGKHLFLGFTGDRVVHVHLGLYGTFLLADGPAPAPVGQVRLRLEALGARTAYADLRGATACELITAAGQQAVLDRLGPDPLRAESDWTRAWEKVRRSRVGIGALLMDQSVLCGIGNVYRAEVLFRHRLHPLRPGRTLRRGTFERVWHDLAGLLADGVRRGRIDTARAVVDHALTGPLNTAPTGGSPVYVYRRQGEPCFVCGATVRSDVLQGRNLFWCPRCQPPFRSRAAH